MKIIDDLKEWNRKRVEKKGKLREIEEIKQTAYLEEMKAEAVTMGKKQAAIEREHRIISYSRKLGSKRKKKALQSKPKQNGFFSVSKTEDVNPARGRYNWISGKWD